MSAGGNGDPQIHPSEPGRSVAHLVCRLGLVPPQRLTERAHAGDCKARRPLHPLPPVGV